jgi:hypothetical protein
MVEQTLEQLVRLRAAERGYKSLMAVLEAMREHGGSSLTYDRFYRLVTGLYTAKSARWSEEEAAALLEVLGIEVREHAEVTAPAVRKRRTR